MISPKFYSQITVCPTCSGWGVDCKDCLGQGVSVVQSENIYIWDAPTFVDYKSRTQVLIMKVTVGIIIVLFIIFIAAFVRFVLLKSLGI